MNIAATWNSKLEKLKKRKTDPLNESKLCSRHGLTLSRVNLSRNGKTVPTQVTIDAVEAAFRSEGV